MRIEQELTSQTKTQIGTRSMQSLGWIDRLLGDKRDRRLAAEKAKKRVEAREKQEITSRTKTQIGTRSMQSLGWIDRLLGDKRDRRLAAEKARKRAARAAMLRDPSNKTTL